MSDLQDTCMSLMAAFAGTSEMRQRLAVESRRLDEAAMSTASAMNASRDPGLARQLAQALHATAECCASAAQLIGAAEESAKQFVQRTVGGSYGGAGADVGSDVAGWAGASGGGSSTIAEPGSNAPAGRGLPNGCEMVPLSQIDVSDSQVHGPADFGKGYSPEDLAWAHRAFHDVILPALAEGRGVDHFSARDAAEGRVGVRSYSDTYSGFFGDSAIKLDRLPDGTYGVGNGYHRIWVARRLGLDAVPARVR